MCGSVGGACVVRLQTAERSFSDVYAEGDLSRRRWDTAVRVNDGIWARTSETSTTHVRSLMCFVGMCDSTHFLTVAIASCAVRRVGCRGEMAVGCR